MNVNRNVVQRTECPSEVQICPDEIHIFKTLLRIMKQSSKIPDKLMGCTTGGECFQYRIEEGSQFFEIDDS